MFLSGVTMHIMHKSPIKSLIIRCANSLDPTLLVKADEQESCKVTFAKLVEKLTYLKCISSKTTDESKDQFCRLIDDIVSHHHQEFSGFKKFDDCLDEFYSQFFRKEKQYTSMWLICQLVFIISHGQATIE